METKNTRSEFTANLMMANAGQVRIGRNFAKPIPRKENKKSFLEKLMKL